MGRVYTFASAKGGVGKTTTTANVGAALAAAGYETAVVDGDLGMPNLGDALGVDPDGATLHHVLVGEATTDEATYEGPDGLAVLPGTADLDLFADIDPADLEGVVEHLDEYDYVLIDAGAGLSHDSLVPLTLCDEVVLVSTAERPALRDTEQTRQVAERLGATVGSGVLTRTGANDRDEAAAEGLDVDVVRTIPEDEAAVSALAEGVPLSIYAPASPAATAYRGLAGTLAGETLPEPGVDREPPSESSDADAETDAGTDVEATGSPETDEETVGDDPGGDETADHGDASGSDESDEFADSTSDASTPSEAAERSTVTMEGEPGTGTDESADGDDAGDSDSTATDDRAKASGDAHPAGGAGGDPGADSVDGAADAATPDGTDAPDSDGLTIEALSLESTEDDASDESDTIAAADVDGPAADRADGSGTSDGGRNDEVSDEASDADADADEDAPAIPSAEGGSPDGDSSDADAPATEINASDGDDGGVYETSLVAEAESRTEGADRSDSDTDDAGGDDGDSGDDAEKKGFFRRLLG